MGSQLACPRCGKRIPAELESCPMCLVARPPSGWPKTIPGEHPYPLQAVKTDAPDRFVDILKRHEGRNIGINVDGPGKLRKAFLVNVRDDYFTVYFGDKGTLLHYPISAVATFLEAENGLIPWQSLFFRLVVYLHPTMFPTSDHGWFMGFSVPLG